LDDLDQPAFDRRCFLFRFHVRAVRKLAAALSCDPL
jgi:hypothetical protein